MTGPGDARDTHELVFLVDVDNTLLDNDRVTADLRRYLEREIGPACTQEYFNIFEALREELGYADYLGALQRYRNLNPRDPRVLYLSHYLIDYPFANRLYPESLDVIDRLRGFGPVVILSDGDVVFQPRKVDRAGLWSAVGGNVLIYVHKEQQLDDVASRYPARHYVIIDDKLRILDAVKRVWGDGVTTVFPQQGHYAHDPKILSAYPPADIAVSRIGELVTVDPATFTQTDPTRPLSERPGAAPQT